MEGIICSPTVDCLRVERTRSGGVGSGSRWDPSVSQARLAAISTYYISNLPPAKLSCRSAERKEPGHAAIIPMLAVISIQATSSQAPIFLDLPKEPGRAAIIPRLAAISQYLSNPPPAKLSFSWICLSAERKEPGHTRSYHFHSYTTVLKHRILPTLASI
jgi:hypothetical protein